MRSRLSRNGIQPFALGPSIPLNSHGKTNGDVSQVPPPRVGKSGAISTLETASGRDRNDNLQSQPPFSRLPENIVAGTTTPLNARDLPSSSIPRYTHKNIPSSGADSLRSTNASASPSRNPSDDRAASGFEATLPNPTSVTDINHRGSGDRTYVNCAQSSSALTSDPIAHTDAERTTSGPDAGGTVAHSINPAIHTEQTGESELRSRSPIQHVDSGIRLGNEELSLPIELPPVYSPN